MEEELSDTQVCILIILFSSVLLILLFQRVICIMLLQIYQHKLHEIEADARELKKALEVKTNSEPPTPIDAKSIGDITRSYQAKLESGASVASKEEVYYYVVDILLG